MPATTLDSQRVGTLESLVPTGVLNHAISPALGQSSLQVNQPVSTYQNASHIRQLVDNMEMLQSQYRNPIVSSETERQLIPRQVNRDPVAIQTFAGWNQASSSSGITPSVVTQQYDRCQGQRTLFLYNITQL
ncbi:E4 SUMO-protein ligase PIAL2-like isoform X1 [Iris pallida]|uniref:E4 SUMO-protein ligase PIAL2-like isoform X1 n=1 Tax=Iris pallida TaxID=29817 RepID=A0AAX6IMS0_IRIPA|nr:E4 SUMO-protein ligase PIAL2-like isoform X1 [Iris pallida]